MKRSSFFYKIFFGMVILSLIYICIGHTEQLQETGDKFLIAIFPIENLSGTKAPIEEIRRLIISKLKERGIHILDDESLEKFMIKNRVRYTGGIDDKISQSFKEETGVDGVLITSLEYYNETNPPKITLTSRLVSTKTPPIILWIDGIGLSGDDSPGLLGLGLIEDPGVLLNKSITRITQSLEDYLYKKNFKQEIKGIKRIFNPKISFRSNLLDLKDKYTIAILPFFNRSERRNAGEILGLQFLKNFKRIPGFEVIEPGIIRNSLLRLRIIMEEGISINQADLLFNELGADLILIGKVMDYQDYQGPYGKPKVEFSCQLIEQKSRKVVWSSNSYNEGDEGVFFFDRGRINTAHELASRMVQALSSMIAKYNK